jgi:hypothetical protein
MVTAVHKWPVDHFREQDLRDMTMAKLRSSDLLLCLTFELVEE